ncbi:DUF4419 domain-containing protein [Limnoglobus roseus]|uniref:DUF4419 domain-containing protein n=1 Tax=Limnoglobus roseus TaxID=2598579 RepID=UPI00143D627C|nr:DUF4419 domain-containing protein [Limnoglobus roseus]
MVAAVHLAFQDHRPLVLSPDIVWLLIAQGFAHHVNANAEALRSKFVQHSDKLTITIRRDDFVKGSPENPWEEVFVKFTDQIRGHVGAQTHELLLPNFSTTGPRERAAAQIVLMEAMQSYFTYEFVTMCGIPQIALEGTADDWTELARRVRDLEAFDLRWWVSALTPILQEFIAAAMGRPSAKFWQSIYKQEGGSGGPYTSGWITAFFPYLKDWRTGLATNPNPWLRQGGKRLQSILYPPADARNAFGNGPTTPQFPSGLARAPFVWKYLDQSFDMEFLGGFVGVRQDVTTLQLKPEIGWAVRDVSPT